MADLTEVDTQCPVCKETFTLQDHYPKLLPCNHTVCKSCVKQLGSDFDCPVCRFHIEGTDLIAISTNFVAVNAVGKEDVASSQEECLNEQSNSDNCDLTPTAEMCTIQEAIASIEPGRETPTVASVEEKLELKFSEAFDETTAKIQKYEQITESLKQSKEQVLEDIESDFENLLQLLLRRKHLLKNQVLTQYEEKLEQIEENMEKVTFTTMCLSSLQKHSEVIFDDHTKAKNDLSGKMLEESTEDLKSRQEEISANLAGNWQTISLEICELQEKLEDTSDIKEMTFIYDASSGQSDVCKCLKTIGKIKLKTCQ